MNYRNRCKSFYEIGGTRMRCELDAGHDGRHDRFIGFCRFYWSDKEAMPADEIITLPRDTAAGVRLTEAEEAVARDPWRKP